MTLKKEDRPSDSCVVCLNAKPTLRYGNLRVPLQNCKHICICYNCYWAYAKGVDHETKMSTCLLCNAQRPNVSFAEGATKGALALACVMAKPWLRSDFFKATKDMLQVAKAQASVSMDLVSIDRLIQICLENHKNMGRAMLTVKQCNLLLLKCAMAGIFKWTGGYRLEKLLVALCIAPWAADKRLGSAGVCYFGNMGSAPSTPHNVWALLKGNRLALLNPITFKKHPAE